MASTKYLSTELRSKNPLRRIVEKSRDKKVLSGLSFAFADHLSYLNPVHWDSVAQYGGVFLSRPYLSTLDDGGVVGAKMRYGIIYREQHPVGCFATQTLDITGDQLVQDPALLSKEDRAQLSLKKLNLKALKRVHRRVTICGNPVSWGMDGFAFDPAEDAPTMWRALAEGLYRLRRADKVYGQTDYVMVKDLPESVREEGAAFATHSYRPLDTEPNMVLTVDPTWSGMEDYLASLTAKYRKAARNVLKSVEKAGATLAPIENPQERTEELHELYQEVAARANVRLAALSPTYLPNLHTRLGGDRFATLGLEASDGTLLGYVTVIRDGNTAVGYFMGVSYEASEKIPVYHRLLFAVIEQALTWKCSRISFGRTALEAKARLGCQPESIFVWVRHRTPLLNIVIRQLLKAVPHDEAPDRNPFKE